MRAPDRYERNRPRRPPGAAAPTTSSSPMPSSAACSRSFPPPSAPRMRGTARGHERWLPASAWPPPACTTITRPRTPRCGTRWKSAPPPAVCTYTSCVRSMPGSRDLLDAVDELAAWWRADGDAALRDRLAGRLEEVDAALRLHLRDEESKILPVVQTVMSQLEWDEVGARARSHVDPRYAFGMLGLMLHAGDRRAASRVRGARPAHRDDALPDLRAPSVRPGDRRSGAHCPKAAW